MIEEPLLPDDSLPGAPHRRSFLSGIAATIIAVESGAARAEPRETPSQKPMAAVTPRALTTLDARAVTRRILPAPAPETPVLGYRGLLPGPILRVKVGEPFSARLENGLSEPTSIHWYGMHGFNSMDGTCGLTQDPVQPGQSFDYSFTPRMAGTNWFHPLVPGLTATQVDRGLTGMLIVEEATPPVVDSEFACFLDDWRLREDGTHAEPFFDALDAARSGRLGNRLTVNGGAGPEVIRLPPRSRIRLRIVNIANARIMPMRFEGLPGASVIAIDGQPTEPFDPLRKQVTLGPGGRFDVMVDFPDAAGKEGSLVIALGEGLPVFRFLAEGAPVETRPKVAQLPDNGLPAAVTLQNAERSVLEIAGGVEAPAPGTPASTADDIRARFKDPRKIWQLNYGRSDGFGGAPLMRVKSGRPCVLAIVNKSAWAQVIHTHGHHFRYLHPFDDGWEPYWLDTLVVPAGQTIRVAFVAETPGRWAIRSSILEHFESGIATWFEVS